MAILDSNLRVLKISAADAELVEHFERLIEFVKRDGAKSIFRDEPDRKTVKLPSEADDVLQKLTIEDVEGLLDRSELPRKYFERLAIVRFGVPKGSMRQWSTKERLIEKVATMMRNERTHRTIGEVARREQGSE